MRADVLKGAKGAGTRRFLRNSGEWSPDTRRVVRLEIMLEVVLSGSEVGRQPVELLDLSIRGCRITNSYGLREEMRVVLTIPTLAPIGAMVRWARPDVAGIRFDNALHPLVAQRIVEMGRSHNADGTPVDQGQGR